MLAERRNKAFTLIELLVVIAIIALLIGILLPALGQARLAGRKAVDLANQKQLATATSSYASEVRDGMNAFTVQAGQSAAYYAQTMPDDPATGIVAADLRAQAAAGSDLAAASAQAIYILRKRGDRSDIQVIDSWIPPRSVHPPRPSGLPRFSPSRAARRQPAGQGPHRLAVRSQGLRPWRDPSRPGWRPRHQ